MPAKVAITGRVSNGTSVWIEDPVIRIGSDPDNDIAIIDPSIPEHAATVEYRDGAYWVYNRGGMPLAIGQQALPAGESAPWGHAGELRLGDATTLLLELSGDGSPERQPPRGAAALVEKDEALYEAEEARRKRETAETAPEDRNGSQRLKAIGQGAVIALCLIAIVAIGISQLGGGSNASTAPPRDFTKTLLKLDDDPDKPLHRFVTQIRTAELLRLRGEAADAQVRFESLRLQLTSRRDALRSQGEELPEDEQQLLDFVLSRLERIK